MELKEEYKNINFVKKIDDMLKDVFKDNPEDETFKIYKESLNVAIKNNWLEHLKVLNLLAEKLVEQNIYFGLVRPVVGILNDPTLELWCWVRKENELKHNYSVYVETEAEYKERMNKATDKSKEQSKIFIKINEENLSTVENILNSICINWENSIIIQTDNDLSKVIEE